MLSCWKAKCVVVLRGRNGKGRQLVVILSLTIRTVGGALSVFNTHRTFVRRIQIVAIGINNSEIYYKHVTNRMKATTPCALLNNEKWKAQNIFMTFWFNAYMQREEPFFTCSPFKSTKYVLCSCYLYPIFIFTSIKPLMIIINYLTC